MNAAPSSSDRSGQTLSATPAAERETPPAPSTSLESQPPPTSVPPTLPVDGETQLRGSSPAGHAGRPASAVESTPFYTGVGTHVVVDATRLRGSAPPPNDVGLPLREKRANTAASGLSAGSSSSSGSSGSGPLGIITALLLIFLRPWFRLLLVPERWQTTVFLALRERPG